MKNGKNDRTVDYILSKHKISGDLFENGKLNVIIGTNALESASLQMIASAAVNLSLRLHPLIKHVHVCIEGNGKLLFNAPKWVSEDFYGHIDTMLKEAHSGVTTSIDTKTATPTYSLVIGRTNQVSKDFISVTSDNWLATVLEENFQDGGETYNPIGAFGAACLAMTEIWHKFITINIGHHESILKDGGITFNTFSYSSDTTLNPLVPKPVNLNDLSIVGVGAGGGATAFTLAALQLVKGDMRLIDKERVSPTNPNRYLYALSSDVGGKKVELVRDLYVNHPELSIDHIDSSFQDLSEATKEQLKHVCCMIDNAETKREVNYATPFIVWDGAAENGELRIGRHVIGVTECVTCKYPPDLYDESIAIGQRAKYSGLAPERIKELMTRSQFCEADIAKIEQFTSAYAPKPQMPAPGDSWSDFEGKNCGQITFDDDREEVYQMPIAPIFVGILTAGEIIKEFYFKEHVLNSRYTVDITKMNLSTHAKPRTTKPLPNCPHCSDDVLLEVYNSKWNL